MAAVAVPTPTARASVAMPSAKRWRFMAFDFSCVVVTSDYRGAPERRGTVGEQPEGVRRKPAPYPGRSRRETTAISRRRADGRRRRTHQGVVKAKASNSIAKAPCDPPLGGAPPSDALGIFCESGSGTRRWGVREWDWRDGGVGLSALGRSAADHCTPSARNEDARLQPTGPKLLVLVPRVAIAAPDCVEGAVCSMRCVPGPACCAL